VFAATPPARAQAQDQKALSPEDFKLVRPGTTEEIDDSSLVRLQGNTRPEATAINDRGRVSDDLTLDHMMLLLQRTPEQEQALRQFIAEIHDPTSPLFHQWITAAEFGQKYGVPSADVARVTDWLESQGFMVNLVYPNRMVIDFSGSAGQIRQAFHTEIHNLLVNGQAHIANMSDPKIPAALAPAVAGVVSLNDFRPRTMFKAVKRAGVGFTFGPDCGFMTGLRDGTNTYCEALMPPDLATIYNFNPVFAMGITGLGQTIVVIEPSDMYSANDWNTFRQAGGLAAAFPYGTLTQTHPPSSPTNNCTDPGDLNDGTDAEVAIDMEWASAAAPNAAIQVAVCANTTTTFGALVALENILNGPPPYPGTISFSYGESESKNGATQNAAYNTTYQQGVTQGVSIFVSSGDEGAASSNADMADSTGGITVSGLTSTPYNISVGGTDFGDAYAGLESAYWNSTNTASYGSAKSYIPEIPWNDSCADTLVINFLGEYYLPSLVNGYGPSGIGTCNTYPLNTTSSLLSTSSGSGGPSNCATGAPTTFGAPASGGTCAGYLKPSWQSIVGNPADGVRDIPDVSLMAANGLWNHFYLICNSNPNSTEVADGDSVASCSVPVQDWPGFGGTSVSSPIWAGIQALVNEYTGQTWGNANTLYYTIANFEYGASGNPACYSGPSPLHTPAASCVFNDVVQGSIYLPCASLGSDGTARLYNCYRPSATDSATDIGVMSAASETFPGLGGPGPVTALNVTASGGGTTSYSSAPTCALTGGGGSGATCTASISGLVTAITETANGSGYTTANPPGCVLSGGGGLGATCSTTVNGSGTITITLQSGGSGYTSAPTCSLPGGSGSGATCTATVHTGVTGITLTVPGSGYTSDATCTLTGGGGSPAATCASIINGVTALSPEAYPAGVGWDFATGIGTVNVYNLVSSVLSATLAPTSTDFGSVAIQTPSSAKNFTLHNNALAPLSISSIGFTGANAGDFSQTGGTCGTPPTTLAAKSSCTIEATLTPSVLGAESATLTVNDSAAAPQYQTLTSALSGTGIADATLTPASYNFRNVAMNTPSAPVNFTLHNSEATPLNISSIGFTGTNASDFSQTNTCGTLPTNLAAGTSCTLSVTFTPSGTGAESATLTVNDSAAAPQYQTLTSALSGTGIADATLTPASYNFRNVAMNTPSAPVNFTLHNSEVTPLNISSIGFTGANSGDFSQTNTCGTLPTNLAAGTSCTLSVTFTPSGTGAESATLTVNDSAAAAQYQTLTSALSGTGIADATLTPASHNFGSVTVKTPSSAQIFTLKNYQLTALNISGIGFTGANYADFSQTNTCGTLPASLAAGASCTISVTFTPSGTGAEKATLTVNDGAAAAQYQTLTSALSGTGAP
jgi:hypothetical protein